MLHAGPAWRRIAVRAALVLGIVYAGSRIVAPVAVPVGSGVLHVRVVPRLPGGKLIVPLGPLGQISWNVVKAPVDVEANLVLSPNAVDLPSAADLDLGRFRSAYLRSKVLWMLVFGTGAGLLVFAGTRMRWWQAVAAGTGATFGVATFVAALAVLTFNDGAFDDPRYRGPIRDVPRILQLVREIRADFPGAKRNIANAVQGLARLHSELLSEPTRPDTPTVRLLLISDIHNNPLGLLLAEQLAAEFDVHGVLDAGDFTDRGTALEGELFARFASLGLPHVIVAGNHEDVAAIRRVRQVPGVTVLTESDDLATIEGVTILGADDPNSRTIESDPFNERADEQVPLICERLRRRLTVTAADVVLVHDPRLGECAAKEAEAAGRPLVFVWGHLHRAAFQKRGSVVSVSPGTSGAAGFKTAKDLPYGFALLELSRVTGLPVSVCLFAFEEPRALADASCHVLTFEDERQPRRAG